MTKLTAKYDKATRSVVITVTPDKKLHPRTNSSLHHVAIADVSNLIDQLQNGISDWSDHLDENPIEL